MTGKSTKTPFHVSSSNAFWRGLNVYDTADIHEVAAKPFDNDTAIIAAQIEQWAVGKQPLLWHQMDRKTAFINELFFSDIQVINLTNLKTPAIIGTVTPALIAEWSYEKITEFLFATSLIRTFVHTDCELTLIDQTDTPHHLAHYNATHHMYTNEKISMTYSFSIKFDQQNRGIEVTPA